MKKRSLLSIALVLPLVLTYHTDAFASKLNELKNQQQQVENKSSKINSSIKKKDSQISEINGQQADLETQMKQIEAEIESTDKKIGEKQVQISDTQKQISSLKNSIDALTKRINERDQLLKQRARAMQTSGGSVDYIDVILDSQSISDLIDRLTAVQTLMNADKEIMEQQKRDQDDLKQKKVEVEKKLSSLQGMLSDLKGMKVQLNQQENKKKDIMKALAAQKKDLEEDKISLQEQQEILAAQKKSIQKAIELEKQRIAEEKRRQEQQKHQNGGNSGSNDLPPVSSGSFTRPAAGYISSEFGYRSGTYSGFHPGIDIANSGSNVPIVAAGDGVVFRAYHSSSYGNCVMITHIIDGKTYTTVYAHMKYYTVGDGQVVRKGQQIGVMGSTGESTGQHLHFEFYVGYWTGPPHPGAVNPRSYVNF
ncbi:peptidoglycan DD-metalloendopeptidase family protein [Bacillus sp. FJAT-49736]|uniref:murein hydrolase activator EnvC family protein n=1 Tax=Bacillus sp. FJAT-49736 TaxID=2833582 RepID=UPI001BC9E189|nr:peptidoglycan DD-metalloendopeptidase family protein [Bacillus sp. FJAT-49736]MBS4174127.1 peptidoglycan DD-metalloendopeptidase family protein [Bacillus sp. FJAT-49736]